MIAKTSKTLKIFSLFNTKGDWLREDQNHQELLANFDTILLKPLHPYKEKINKQMSHASIF